jgi:hypothetical protein
VTGWADCDGLSNNGCEANISLPKTCDYDCVNCDALPGIDRTFPHACVADAAAGAGQFRCQYTCPGAGQSNCADRDQEWQNGCERAQNGDVDRSGLFVNQGDYMDCSVMEEEAIVNPELFRHHLHIDLTAPVPTSVDTLPPGSIFCNNDLVPSAPLGKCHFICIPGFINDNGFSYDGCETLDPSPTRPYRFIFPGLPADIPLQYGGRMIGDYEVEYYMAWLNYVAPTLPLTLPYNYGGFNFQLSAFLIDYTAWNVDFTDTTLGPAIQPILWY